MTATYHGSKRALPAAPCSTGRERRYAEVASDLASVRVGEPAALLQQTGQYELRWCSGCCPAPWRLSRCTRMRVITAGSSMAAVLKRMLAPLDNRQGAGQHPEHPPRAPPQRVLPGLME